MLLHTLGTASNAEAVDDCLRIIREHDALLLLDDGVYLAQQHPSKLAALDDTGVSIFALRHDCEARGVVAGDSVMLIDIDDFVALTERCEQHMDWS